MTNGVLYQLTGARAAEVLCVSLYSLRQHYGGPVCILATDASWDIADTIARHRMGDVQVRRTEVLTEEKKGWQGAKSWGYFLTPFDRTIAIDCDTVVVGPIDDLFSLTDGVAVTQIADYRLMDERGLPTRLRKFVEHFTWLGPGCRLLGQECAAANPALINTGVVAYGQDRAALWEAHHLFLAGRDPQYGIHDQYALQVCMHRYVGRTLTVVDDRWNWSPKYSHDRDRARIIHYHRHRWLNGHRKEWGHWYSEALTHNAGRLAEWTGTYEPKLLDGSTT